MIASLAALVLASLPYNYGRPCSLHRLDACKTTNYLVWDTGFRQAMKRFFGPVRGDYIRSGLVYQQAIDALNGAPDDAARLSDSGWLFSACLSHDCSQRGAVVITAAGRIVAVGLLNSHCGPRPVGPDRFGCDQDLTLDLFAKESDRANVSYMRTLATWGEADEIAARWPTGTPKPSYKGLIFHALKR
jgi:hypothetical protein